MQFDLPVRNAIDLAELVNAIQTIRRGIGKYGQRVNNSGGAKNREKLLEVFNAMSVEDRCKILSDAVFLTEAMFPLLTAKTKVSASIKEST